jgi:hypothetical protein
MKMFEVYDLNTNETMFSFRTKVLADECARDMNTGKLDKMYAVRREAYDDEWLDRTPWDSDRERWGGNY